MHVSTGRRRSGTSWPDRGLRSSCRSWCLHGDDSLRARDRRHRHHRGPPETAGHFSCRPSYRRAACRHVVTGKVDGAISHRPRDVGEIAGPQGQSISGVDRAVRTAASPPCAHIHPQVRIRIGSGTSGSAPGGRCDVILRRHESAVPEWFVDGEQRVAALAYERRAPTMVRSNCRNWWVVVSSAGVAGAPRAAVEGAHDLGVQVSASGQVTMRYPLRRSLRHGGSATRRWCGRSPGSMAGIPIGASLGPAAQVVQSDSCVLGGDTGGA